STTQPWPSALGPRLDGGSSRSKTIAAVGERRVPRPLQHLHHRLLDEAIQNGWDASFRTPPSGLGISARDADASTVLLQSFCAAGFPHYGWKAGMSDRVFPMYRPVKACSRHTTIDAWFTSALRPRWR